MLKMIFNLFGSPALWKALLEGGKGTIGAGASSHSLKNFYSSISEPSQGQPHFVGVGYVDGQVFVHYDSHSRREQPRVSWIKKVEKEDPQYWDTQTQILRNIEEAFRGNLETLRLRYNQSEGGRRGQEAKWGWGGSWRGAQDYFQDPSNLEGEKGQRRKKPPFGALPESLRALMASHPWSLRLDSCAALLVGLPWRGEAFFSSPPTSAIFGAQDSPSRNLI
ncbi:HLA class I histocompatibility antigen B-38 alpha chain-like [Crotalus adamanteus]|uniref:HLA class I histocompatibility antigen B-38 alpha chain-like n=1 Tax=Crotalus adamanteus TaxID=8729 RepID=A0AAW1BVD5_CROAD